MQTTLTVAILSAFFFLHDFHVTHTTLHYNSSEESIEITIKAAIEDIETALEDKGAENLEIGTDKEHEKAEQWIRDYFKQRLVISPNGKPAEYTWVGKEVSNDLHDVYVYFELVDCNKNGPIESLAVENTIFTEILPHQSNIVLIDFGENKHTLTFTKDQSNKSIVLNKD
ncbi:MAG: hypothetical protein JJ975_08780 [Bacteroidia bacterium]|nr:hypothetical protein [Bacteroidia bacterium]